ncbi:carbohydrate esterase family 3 protein [Daldinia caldariorum]|uniref:carbohydrate esterase family 3 protein n=1 Tax=Daldinia caldariorum TaxID=326644 RepID=UPI0020086DBD|nr:carbohydrate esterase family 3 protein [Daldinia caldariorum]KAI1471689.1 carbohydrate esterase family 3 protein [Daldinia caldariorum]
MLVSSPFSALCLRWKQLPNLHKVISISGLFIFLLVIFIQPNPDVARDGWNRLTHSDTGPLAGGIPLRVMFIGASMTLGEHSTGEVGFRKQIRDWMVARGNPVNYVGQNRYGDFKDNDVQAFGAQPIKPTLDRLKDIVPQTQPNLVIINAGSSDCFQLDHWGPAYVFQKMRDLVDFIFEASPRATIIMSTIIMSPWEGTEKCVKSSNAQIRQVAIDLIREGKPVVMAEMHHDQGLPHRVVREDIGKDDMHPTDKGYFKMGDIFIEKIIEVEKNGWLQAPVENGVPADGEAARDIEEAMNASKEKAKEKEEKEKGNQEGKEPQDKKEKKSPSRRSHEWGRGLNRRHAAIQ